MKTLYITTSIPYVNGSPHTPASLKPKEYSARGSSHLPPTSTKTADAGGGNWRLDCLHGVVGALARGGLNWFTAPGRAVR